MNKFEVMRGTNISHWLSQSARRGEPRAAAFTTDDILWLKSAGFDHLRLPVDEEQLWDECGRREPAAWDLLLDRMQQCHDAGLRIVLDLHILRSHHFNQTDRPLFSDTAAQAVFLGCWEDLSREFSNWPVSALAYELMNEPVAERAEDWNRVFTPVYRRLRELEPERVIALGSNKWQQAVTFPELAVPENDKRLILSVHYYNPMPVTHYRAPWVTQCAAYEGPVHYPGEPVDQADLAACSPETARGLAEWNRHYDLSVMAAEFAPAIETARHYGLPLWCSEFGCREVTPEDVRRRWYGDIRKVFEKNAIAWANWDYRGGFGLRDAANRPTVALEVLMQGDG